MPPPLPARVWPTASMGFARSSFYKATAERPPARRGNPAIRGRPGWHPPGRARDTARLARLLCRGIRFIGKRVLRVMRQPALARIAAAAVAEIPMSVRSSPMPPTSCGALTAFGCSRWTTAGAGYSSPSIGTECVGKARRLRRPSLGLARLYAYLRRCGAGAGLRMDHGCQYLSDHFTNQIKHPAVLRLREQPQQRRSSRSPMVTASRKRLVVQCRVDWRRRLPEPRSSSSGVASPRCQPAAWSRNRVRTEIVAIITLTQQQASA